VLGLDPQAAGEQLVAAGLEVVVAPEAVHDEQVATGLVLDQDPDPRTRALRGSTVTLVLSSGPDRRTVPELAGTDVDTARAELEALGLGLGLVTEDFSDAPVGAVLRSEPAAGQSVKPETPVAVVVSKGLEMLAVPSVVGRAQADAGRQLEAAGFTTTVREAFSEDVGKGTVVAQTPAEGQAPRGSAVQLDVSKGPELVTVPDLGGMSREQAEAALKAAGLKANINARPGPGGAVRFQDPGAGAQVRKGSTVTVFVF
jgi:serine/threonine-protein kinase